MIKMIIFFLATFVCGVVSVVSKEGGVRALFVYLSIMCALILGVLVEENANHPKAIDVYRGKTDLQVNCKIVGNDTIVSDSTVVYKNN